MRSTLIPRHIPAAVPAGTAAGPAGAPPRRPVLPVVLSTMAGLLLAAHFLRDGNAGGAAACLLAPLLLAFRRPWAPVVLGMLLLLGAAEWIRTAVGLIALRQAAAEPWGRLALVLGAVAAVTFWGAVSVLHHRTRRAYRPAGRSPAAVSPGGGSAVSAEDPRRRLGPGLAAFLVAAIFLAAAQLAGDPPLILLERLLPGGGWLQGLLLAVYAAWLTEKLLDPTSQPVWRRRIWLGFSLVFFGQLALGLAGFERLLMSGELHLPVPAMIVAGPLFRGDGLFMPILLAVTLLLVGPAWCSHLCYIGAWDHAASRARKAPRRLPGWTRHLRWWLLGGVAAAAIGLRLAGTPALLATWLGAGFGLFGVLLMVLWSRRSGAMAHCVAYCPIGLVADLGGKLSPFRIRIGSDCTDCMKCRLACRYDALNPEDIARRRPGLACTLCGDCLGRCETRQLAYRLELFGRRVPWVGPRAARGAFVALAAAAHAVFLGVARI